MAKKSDPTKDPQFQNVVQHFLKTPPKPHAPLKAKPSKDQEVRRKTEKSKTSK